MIWRYLKLSFQVSLMEYNYKLTITYDGTNYSGWQIQPNGISIQELMQKLLKRSLKKMSI